MPGLGLAGVAVALVGLVVFAMLLVGLTAWVIPLVIGLVWRRRGRAGAAAWITVGGVWGGFASALVLAGVVAAIRWSPTSGGPAAFSAATQDTFDPSACAGGTAAVHFAFEGEVSLTGRGSDAVPRQFRGSNGTMVLPAGPIDVQEIAVRAGDAAGRIWTARSRPAERRQLSLAAAASTNLDWGPPFLTAVRVEASPVSPTVRLEPSVADRAGHEFELSSSPRGPAPSFVVVGPDGREVWRGAFEYG